MNHTAFGRIQSKERVEEITSAIASGKTREQVAEELGYTNYRSLDMFMRRRHYSWYPSRNNYYPNKQIKTKKPTPTQEPLHTKIQMIIKLFEQKIDAREIAKRLQFQDHREISQFMQYNGYKWNYDNSNYIFDEKSLHNENKKEYTGIQLIEQYLPLLKELEANWDDLIQLLTCAPSGVSLLSEGSGPYTSRSIRIDQALEQRIHQYSRENNISVHQIIEEALTDFFKK